MPANLAWKLGPKFRKKASQKEDKKPVKKLVEKAGTKARLSRSEIMKGVWSRMSPEEKAARMLKTNKDKLTEESHLPRHKRKGRKEYMKKWKEKRRLLAAS